MIWFFFVTFLFQMGSLIKFQSERYNYSLFGIKKIIGLNDKIIYIKIDPGLSDRQVCFNFELFHFSYYVHGGSPNSSASYTRCSG